MALKLDILVLSSHPDDAELGCGGTIIKHVLAGKKVGIADLTAGELGTRGTAESRAVEASEAARIMGVATRVNVGLPDGFFRNTKEAQLEVVKVIRRFQPEIVLANAVSDRHPDHGRGAKLAFDSCFLAGLKKVETMDAGVAQTPWRPRVLYHYIQSEFIIPDFVVDISSNWDRKMEAIRAFKSQFYDPSSKEPETYISKPGFLKMLEARAVEMGHAVGFQYGEGFTKSRWIGVDSLFDLS